MSAPSRGEALATRRRRMQSLDGLRGIAIVLVVLSHGWALWPFDSIRSSALVGLFRSGNLAVTIFFVIGGYLLTRSLLAEVGRTGKLNAGRAAVRRYIRISAHVYALIIAILIVHAVDETDVYPGTNLPRSVLRIATYTWNWFIRDSALMARPDLGHLWYISVYMQVALLLILLVRILGNRRVALVLILAALTVVLLFWRFWVVDNEPLVAGLLRTSARMDAMIWGALVAAAMPWIHKYAKDAARYFLPLSLLTLIVLMLTTEHDESYFRLPGLLLNLAAVTFVAGVMLTEHNPRVLRPLEWAPLVALGNASMAIYVWHYPIFWAVARHTPQWAWPARTALALAITGVCVIVAQRVVEGPLQGWLRRSDERARTEPTQPRPRALAEPTD